jgi:AraC-like DNA-binding protein
MSIDQQTAYALSAPQDVHDAARQGGAADSVCFWREPRYGDLECLTARFFRHAYTPHVHDTFAIGVVVEGAEAFRYRGARHVAPAGSLVAVNPGELHDGCAAVDGFAYRMLYPSVEMLQSLAEELSEHPAGLPAFGEAVTADPETAALLCRAHALMEAQSDKLAVDQALTAALGQMVRRYARITLRHRPLGREAGPIQRARRQIDDLYMQDLTLESLAEEARLSRYHFLRAFRREVGVTPHAYLTSRRIAAAKQLLAGEAALSEVALACGFYDQSHFSRSFKGTTGVTPGQYRRGARAAA